MTTTPQHQYDAALGAFLGACVGDAAGAVLEFMSHTLTEQDIHHALTMPGGGVWSVAPGQITDDCELGLCLAHGLAQSRTFDLEAIARAYARWIESPPFDIGTTTIQSLGAVEQEPWRTMREAEGYAAAMRSAAAQRCMDSKSNGSLMRAAPLGIWGHRFTADEIGDFARQDSCLSHPNPSSWQAVACYTIAIAHLVNHLGDRAGAFAQAVAWANQHANAEVQSWLADAAENVHVPYEPQIGFVRIGFTHAFRHLRLGTSYMDALGETLAGGGDTDTNACIVCGLIGAAEGAESIPDALRNAVLTCNTQLGRPRPAFLHAGQVPELVTQLL